jgi:hypothetical protein
MKQKEKPGATLTTILDCAYPAVPGIGHLERSRHIYGQFGSDFSEGGGTSGYFDQFFFLGPPGSPQAAWAQLQFRRDLMEKKFHQN